MGKGTPIEHDHVASLLFPLPASHHVSSRFLTLAGPLLVFAKVLLEGPLSPYNTIAALPKDTQLKNAFLMIALVDAHCRKWGRDWDLWRREDPNSTPRGVVFVSEASPPWPVFTSFPQSLPVRSQGPSSCGILHLSLFPDGGRQGGDGNPLGGCLSLRL